MTSPDQESVLAQDKLQTAFEHMLASNEPFFLVSTLSELAVCCYDPSEGEAGEITRITLSGPAKDTCLEGLELMASRADKSMNLHSSIPGEETYRID